MRKGARLRLEAIAAANLPQRMELALEGGLLKPSRFLEMRRYARGDKALLLPVGAISGQGREGSDTLLLPFDDLETRAALWSEMDANHRQPGRNHRRLIELTLFRVVGYRSTQRPQA